MGQTVQHSVSTKDPWRIIAIIVIAVAMMLLLCMKAAGCFDVEKKSQPSETQTSSPVVKQ